MVPLGAAIGALTLSTLRTSFDIPADSRDEQLHGRVDRQGQHGLKRFVVQEHACDRTDLLR
ncbi:hypothetical protein WCLP8_650002 [uncultured Gammaproteobacteria bacterium]